MSWKTEIDKEKLEVRIKFTTLEDLEYFLDYIATWLSEKEKNEVF